MAGEYTWESLMEENAQSAILLDELIECKKRSAELADAVREQANICKALRDEVEMEINKLQNARENIKRRTAHRTKVTCREEHSGSLMSESVAVRLDEQTAAQRRPLTTWLRRFLLFLGLLQLVFVILVLLKRDILHWVLPAELATALGSRPPKPLLF